ncbi:hypothetical protein CALVIDRAFT_89288 [Calocera viscosa TUFC12733]|uniref:Altered inheritance of mitochondria protein 9, mitochondrial n=1 Tax=Calocera viscosa (strain TUFC12733) TaxID=1330018 RepID=A0A167FFI2_CALVF|nr:hypothetical protein CALVIDRAFT_89288 [Calocera viscosa TUFC12733]
MDTATASLGSPCTGLRKLPKDGREVIGRIPHTLMPEHYLSVASEAATLSFLALRFQLRVPTAFAYSASASPNPVETPYMIMEKMPGVDFNDCSESETGHGSVHREVVRMQALLHTASLGSIGSIFFKTDIREDWQTPLYAPDENADDASRLFCIGPCMDPVFSRLREESDRAVAVDRGPWPTTS